jgi:Lon protease-like protein
MEQIDDTRQLPLFPLPLVLVPNEVLPLHIFEERYRQMLSDVASREGQFGITVFETDEFPAVRPEPGSIGCVAEVRDIDTLSDGRSNILVVGILRYRLLEYVEGPQLYNIGVVEYFEDEPGDKEVLDALAESVLTIFRQIAKAAHKLSGRQGPIPDIIADDPETLSFQITATFITDNLLKYEFLKMTDTAERLERLKEKLIQSVDQIERQADIQFSASTNGHGKPSADH